jgi:pimeloyl-ACP methyl ester carboxylesterase
MPGNGRETGEAMSAARDNESYRQAEAELWSEFGLTAHERVVEAGPARTKIRVTEVGQGSPVVFVGGTGGTGPYWAPLVARLDVRAVIVDRPGFGLSDPVAFKAHPHRALVTSILEDVLDAVEVHAAVTLVGASIGDVWALTAAEQLPDRVGAVVLLGGGPISAAVTPPPFIRLLRSPLGAAIVRVPQRPGMLRGQLRGMGHGASLEAGRIPDSFFTWQAALMRMTPSMRHERRMVQAVLGRDGFVPDLRFDGERGKRIEQPVLMIVGEHDPVGSIDIWTEFVGALGNGTLQVVPGAGHLSWWDEPDRVATSVRDHIGTRT